MFIFWNSKEAMAKQEIYHINIKNVLVGRSLFPYEQIKNQSKFFDSFSGVPEGQWPKRKKYHIKIKNLVVKRSLFFHGHARSQPRSFDSFSGAPENQWPKRKNLSHQD